MGKGGCGLKPVLIIVNKVLLALGIIAIIVGAIAYWGKDVLINATSIYAFITVKLGKDDFDLKGLKLEDMLEPVGIALMVLGIVICAICIIGLCGAQHESACLLTVYAVLVLVVAAAQISIIIAFYGLNSTLQGIVKEAWNKTITDYYAGDDDTSDQFGSVSLFWTAINRNFDCCGVDNFWDFHGATNWNRTTSSGGTYVTPLSCCVYNQTFLKDSQPVCGTTCATNPTTACNNFETSCYTKIESYVRTPSYILLCIGIGTIVTEIALALIAICLCKKSGDKGSDKD